MEKEDLITAENLMKEVLSSFINDDRLKKLFVLINELGLHIDLSNYGFNYYTVSKNLINNTVDYDRFEDIRKNKENEALRLLQTDLEGGLNLISFEGRGQKVVYDISLDGIYVYDIATGSIEEILSLNECDKNNIARIKKIGSWQ